MAFVVDIKFVDESENFDFEKRKKGLRKFLFFTTQLTMFTMTSDPLTMGREAMGTNLKLVARSLKQIEKDYRGARRCVLSPHSLLVLYNNQFMVRRISRQRGGLAALKLTKLIGIDDFPAAKDCGKVLIKIIYCYLIM